MSEDNYTGSYGGNWSGGSEGSASSGGTGSFGGGAGINSFGSSYWEFPNLFAKPMEYGPFENFPILGSLFKTALPVIPSIEAIVGFLGMLPHGNTVPSIIAKKNKNTMRDGAGNVIGTSFKG